MSDTSEEEKKERGAASRSDLQKRARKLQQASSPSANYKQTVKAVKSDLHTLKEVTRQRQRNVPQPSAPSPTRSPGTEQTAGVPPLPDIELPSPPYRPGKAFTLRKSSMQDL